MRPYCFTVGYILHPGIRITSCIAVAFTCKEFAVVMYWCEILHERVCFILYYCIIIGTI